MGRALAFAAILLGYGIAGGLLALWLNRNPVAVIAALMLGGVVIGGLLGRTLLRSPPWKEKPGAPSTGPERPRE
jgi:hypothetical protein